MGSLKFDICGIFAIIVTYISIFYTEYCMLVNVLHPLVTDSLWGSFHAVLFNTFLFLLVYAHIKAIVSDPGRIPLPEVAVDFSDSRRSSRKGRKGKTNDNWTACQHCEMFRPPRSHHCRTCRRCIRKMDHHCIWIYNCIGEHNLKCFLLFLFYVIITSIYSLLLCAILYAYQIDDYDNEQIRARKVQVIILFVLSVFFCFFGCWMMYDQLYCVFNDVTSIELAHPSSAENEPHVPKSKMAYLTEVCGGGSYWKWFLPFGASLSDVECRESTLYV